MFSWKFKYAIDSSKDVIALTPTAGTIFKACAPSLIYIGVFGAFLAWANYDSRKNDEELVKEFGNE